jgi:hypothetical protein
MSQPHEDHYHKEMAHESTTLFAGAAAADITPEGPVILCGYPHVERISTGIYDRLTSSALFLFDGVTPLLFVANDIISISKSLAGNARRRIQDDTGISASHVVITATHTHSGPVAVDILCTGHDPTVPAADPSYLRRLEDGIVTAAVGAYRNAKPARLGLTRVDGSCVGTNRHDPHGPSDPQVPVVVVREQDGPGFIAVMLVCNMHPTVLHEDSRLISGDFPAAVRQFLQERIVGRNCPVLYHMGAGGNQSPRHVAWSNTFAEVDRLGGLLGQAVGQAILTVADLDNARFSCATVAVELPRRRLPSVQEAEESLRASWDRFQQLRDAGAPRGEIRTAECDWFGAEEDLTLARAAADGRLDAAIASIMPAEITAVGIGPWTFVGWPGEMYVEFALSVRASYPDCHLISLANGEMQSYLVTEEAVRQRHYESLNSLLTSPESGNLLVQATFALLEEGEQRS